eukprot:scaffold7759_cov22-Tisochrysis_lutea.AAC.2
MAHHETLAAWVWGCWHQEMPCEQRYASTFKCCLLQWFLVFGPEGAYSLPQPASLHLITKCVDAADVQIWSALCSYRCRELHVPCPATSGSGAGRGGGGGGGRVALPDELATFALKIECAFGAEQFCLVESWIESTDCFVRSTASGAAVAATSHSCVPAYSCVHILVYTPYK